MDKVDKVDGVDLVDESEEKRGFWGLSFLVLDQKGGMGKCPGPLFSNPKVSNANRNKARQVLDELMGERAIVFSLLI